MDDTPSNSFDYVLQALLDGRCVPFLGAGISIGAKPIPTSGAGTEEVDHSCLLSVDNEQFPMGINEVVTNCQSMINALASSLDNKLRASSDSTHSDVKEILKKHTEALNKHKRDIQIFEEELELFNRTNDRSKQPPIWPALESKLKLGQICEYILWSCCNAKSEEVVYTDIVQTITAHHYHNLVPTTAHFYLAYLAREGLVSRVFTTNYDCCLERAYLSSWGKGLADEFLGEKSTPRDMNRWLTGRIYDDYTNAQFASRGLANQRDERGDSAHCLRVFKLNGCTLSLHERRANCSSILLTELQLRAWRDRTWGRDAFRNALRSASLFFCGFGSDEPQIIHTVQQVLEEFSIDITVHQTDAEEQADKIGSSTQSVLSWPNAPIISTYTSSPSFHQRQIAQGFVTQVCGTYSEEQAMKLFLSRRELPRAKAANATNADANLSADELFEKLYCRALQHLVFRGIQAARHAAHPAFKVMYGDLLNAWQPQRTESIRQPDWMMRWFGATAPQDEVRDPIEGQAKTPLLVQILCALQNRYNAKRPGRYCAVNDHGALAGEFLFLAHLLGLDQKPEAFEPITGGLGVQIDLMKGFCGAAFQDSRPVLFVSAQAGSVRPTEDYIKPFLGCRRAVQLVLAPSRGKLNSRLAYLHPTLGGDFQRMDLFRFYWEPEKYLGASTPSDVLGLKAYLQQRLKALIETPNRFSAYQRRHLSQHPRLQIGVTP